MNEPVYPHGSPEWCGQVARALDALADTYTKDSLYERSFKRLLGVAAKWYRFRAGQRGGAAA